MPTAQSDIEEQVRRVLAEGPPLRLAVLFGTAAAGRLRPDSDVDLAILPADPELSLAHELDLAARLSSVLGREVDLVRLDRAPTLLRWEVASKGAVVWSRSPAEAVRFRAEAASEHADFAPAWQRAAERFRRHLVRSVPSPGDGT